MTRDTEPYKLEHQIFRRAPTKFEEKVHRRGAFTIWYNT
jgi:hypothetical protein